MSYYFPEDTKEIEKISSYEYAIDCPKCEHEVELIEENFMPWNEDEPNDFTCPKCNKKFTVRPVYKFVKFESVFESEEQGDEY